MVNFLLPAAAALALFASSALATLTINTPSSLVACEPTLISWSGGTAPYYVTVLPGGVISTTLESLVTDLNITSYTWTVNIAGGSAVTLALKDSTGALAYTAAVTIEAGTSTSCVNVTDSVTSVAADSTTSSTTSLTGATTSTSATTTSTSTKASSTFTSTSSAASSAAATSTSGATHFAQISGVMAILAGLAVVLA